MDFKNFQDWSKNESRIYSEFETSAKNLVNTGLKPKPEIMSGKGDGYLIGLQYSDELSAKVSDLSKKVSEVIDSVVYFPENVHTTLTSILEDNFQPNQDMLKKLSEIAEGTLALNLKAEITFNQWLVNQDSIIAQGIPNQDFFELGKYISETSGRMELRMPKMAHITTARFAENASVDKIDQILGLIKTTPTLGKAEPKWLVVGYFYTTEEKFELHPYKKWKL